MSTAHHLFAQHLACTAENTMGQQGERVLSCVIEREGTKATFSAAQ